MSIDQDTYVSLLVISILAFSVPLVMGRIRAFSFPVVVAEIIIGAVFGKSGLGLINHTVHVDFIAEFGFVFLMFVSGLELDLGLLRRSLSPRAGLKAVLTGPLLLGTCIFLGTVLTALAISLVLYRAGLVKSAVFMALVLSTTSVGIVMPTLKERGEINSNFGQTLMVSSVIADFLTMLLLTVIIFVHRRGFDADLLIIFVVLAATAAVYIAMNMIRKWPFMSRLLRETAHASTQIRVRGAFTLMMIFLALSHVLGTEIILGAFLAGAVLGSFAPHERGLLRTKLDAIGYGFFIPVFFIMVGARFELENTGSVEALIITGVILIAAFASKILPSLLLLFRFGTRQALAGGVLLSARLSLIIVAADLGLRAGLISQNVEAGIIIVAVAACLLSPVIYGRIIPPGEKKSRKFILAGLGDLGRELATQLVARGYPVVVMDQDEAKLENLPASVMDSVRGDLTDPDTFERAGVGANDVVIAMTGSDSLNQAICMAARDHSGVDRLIARDNDPENTEDFRKNGIVPMNLYYSGAVVLRNLATRPSFFNIVSDAAEERDLFELEVKNSALREKTLSNLPIAGSALIICIRRGDELVVPHGSTRLVTGDQITVFATYSEREKLEKLLAGGT